MKIRHISKETMEEFKSYLLQEEKSAVTVEKYIRDVLALKKYADGCNVDKNLIMEYKNHLNQTGYAVRSINSMLASINSFLVFMKWEECRVKNIRMQKQTYCSEEKVLTKKEYYKLLNAARNDSRLFLIIQTLCGTGIRVSELQFFTIEAVSKGKVIVDCKSKTRCILIPEKLRRNLLLYAKKRKIKAGPLFLAFNGKNLDRSRIWAMMKNLSEKAGVRAEKIFPHNLRKLFARTFYELEKDIAKLADVLGHSNIETTRIYIMTSGNEHREKIEKLGLVI